MIFSFLLRLKKKTQHMIIIRKLKKYRKVGGKQKIDLIQPPRDSHY